MLLGSVFCIAAGMAMISLGGARTNGHLGANASTHSLKGYSSNQPTGQIQHFVFMVKENRTFDNYFGTFPGANGVATGITSSGLVLPLTHSSDRMPRDLCHYRSCAITDVDNGKMDGFDLAGGNVNGDYLAYSQFWQQDIPNYWQYAQHFVLGDNMFSSLTGPSYPNHCTQWVHSLVV